MPSSAAMYVVLGRVQASHSGGCGFCTGLGMTLRAGIEMYLPSRPVKGVSVMQRSAARVASSHWARFSPGSTRKPSSSATVDDSPLPNSTRPLETRSSVEIRSATRKGWLMLGGMCMMPWPEADVLRPLAGGGQEDLRRRGVGVLLQEVVLGDPDAVDADAGRRAPRGPARPGRPAVPCLRSTAWERGAPRTARFSSTPPVWPTASRWVRRRESRASRILDARFPGAR